MPQKICRKQLEFVKQRGIAIQNSYTKKFGLYLKQMSVYDYLYLKEDAFC